jgi:hypothetical protein
MGVVFGFYFRNLWAVDWFIPVLGRAGRAAAPAGFARQSTYINSSLGPSTFAPDNPK